MKSPEKTNKGAVVQKRLVRRCFNCLHATKGFKLSSGTHHHCTHPATVAGIKEWTAWDTLVEWHFRCDKWEPKKTLLLGAERMSEAQRSSPSTPGGNPLPNRR
jgi:hypothetical protein